MNYLLDKKIKRKKFFRIIFFIFISLILLYFRLNIFNGFAYASHKLFSPILVLGNNIGGKLRNAGSYFLSKNSLYLQNQNLQSQLRANEAQMSSYNSLLSDNESLKEILGRKNAKTNMVVSAILSKPNQSFYDSLVIDAGAQQGVKIGNMIFALGNVPIGQVDAVFINSSKVILFSNPGEKTQAVFGKGIFAEVVGRGGGNFEIMMPRDFILAKGDQAILPGIRSYVLAAVETIISDPRESFQKALLVSPVNIQELKFVEVETSP